MSWSDYIRLIRQQNTNLEEWQAADSRTAGFTVDDTRRQLGAAIYDVLDETNEKPKVFRGLAMLMLHFVDRAGEAAALQQQVENLEREARELADLLAAAQERVAELENAVDEAQLQADEYRDERDRARTEVLFLQDRVSSQSTFEGLQELFRQQKEIEEAIQRTAEVVFAPDTVVYWDHNGHPQHGRVQRVEHRLRSVWVWVVNANTNVTRCLDIRQLRTEAMAVEAMYGVEAAG